MINRSSEFIDKGNLITNNSDIFFFFRLNIGSSDELFRPLIGVNI